MPLPDFSPEAIAEKATRIKREIEHAFDLPIGTCDRVDNDLIRLLVWRDTRSDPGPLSEGQRRAYGAQYFNTIFQRKVAQGELIFPSFKHAKDFLLECGFRSIERISIFWRDNLRATIVRTGIIFRVTVRDVETDTLLNNRKDIS